MFRKNAVDVSEAHRLASNGAMLIDVRTHNEVQHGMAERAVHVPQQQVPAALPKLNGSQVLVICRSGNRSARAAAWLRRNGVDALNVRGGMIAWQRNRLPMKTR